MTSNEKDLSWDDLNTLTAEVIAEEGPGSESWDPAKSKVDEINERYMRALRENNGVVPGELSDVPSLIITTTGAKSGKKRSVPLAYALIDGRLLIIASMGGAKRNPPWFHNLLANPEVLVEKDGESFEATATVAEGVDRDSLFASICERMPVFATYQERTSRTIPVVELIRKN